METFHPVAAHFAVVLPLVAFVFQVLYVFFKNPVYAKSATVLLAVATVMVGFAYLSGGHDAKEFVAEILNTYDEAGMHELKEHAELGLNLLIAMGVVLALNLATYKYRQKILSYVVLAGMLAMTLGMFAQGKMGGEVIYGHGEVFKAHAIKDTLKTALEDIEDAENDTEKTEIFTEAINEALGTNSEE